MDKRTKLAENEEKIKKLDENIHDIFVNAQDCYDEDFDEVDYENELLRLYSDPNYQASSYEDEKRILQLENRKIIYELEKEAFDSEFEILSKNFRSGIMSSDKESDIDALDRKSMAKILVRHIVRKDVDTPINIGVFGEWGEGKSSFLKLMQNEIKELNSKKYNHVCHTHVIRYDASEYDEKNKIWASLLSAMFKEYENKQGVWGKIKFGFFNLKKSIKSNWLKYVLNLFVLILSIIWLNIFSTSDNSIQMLKSNLFAIAGIVPLILFATNILIPFVKKQLEFVKPLSDRVLSFIDTPDYSQELGARENIKNTFSDLMSVWIGEKGERIVIFIDELDRCSDKTITEFFDAMQLLLSVKGITVVMSVNYRTVCYSLANNNKHYFSGDISEEQKLRFGLEYLKKYINIPIHLLKSDNYDYYISDIMGKINKNGAEAAVKNNENIEVHHETEHGRTFSEDEIVFIKNVLNWVNKRKRLTPRELKNIINILILSKELIFKSNISKNSEQRLEFKSYINWLFYHYFNRETSAKLVDTISLMENEYLFSTVEQGNKEKKFAMIYSESESMSKDMFPILHKIKIKDIYEYKKISTWFIGERTL